MKSHPGLAPALYLRKHFTIDSTVKEARLYATAQGVYKVIINGQQVSDSHLGPGWTDFNQTIQYQVGQSINSYLVPSKEKFFF
jgi:alpha-L-rhamnosidase